VRDVPTHTFSKIS